MSTGIGDVTQSIGRILRRKNKHKPLVIDITDKEFLIGQAKRRTAYYKKNNFEILGYKKEKEPELDITVSMFDDKYDSKPISSLIERSSCKKMNISPKGSIIWK